MNKKSSDEIFINRWRKYQGFGGFLRYIVPFLLGGLLIAPIVMSCINPNIWEQLQKSDFDRVLMPFILMMCLCGIIPVLGIGIVLWRRNQQRFMQLVTKQDRYLPLEERTWQTGEKTWKIAFSIMNFVVGISLFISFGLLLVHNAPDYFAYPFYASIVYCAWLLVYEIFIYWWALRHDGALYVPAFFKVLFVVSFVALCGTWIMLFLKYNNLLA